MDPLSVTLAAITLATAVKDLVELGQKICESFAKVSKNLRSAQHIAQNIMEMVEEIKVFCEDNKDVLCNMKNFCGALQGLLCKFRNFETSILPLLPKTGQSKLGPLIRGWLNNNKIEEHIASLQTDIVTVMRRYMMSSTMRIELKQGENHQETIRSLRGIAQGLEVVQRDIGALDPTCAITTTHYSSKFAHTTRDEVTSSIIMFAQSTPSASMPMLRSPDVITEEVATTVYIKVQIGSIATIVERMSTMPISTQGTVKCPTWTRVFEEHEMGIMHLRHHIVQQLINIRNLLENEYYKTLGIYDDALTLLHNLSIGLYILGMNHETVLVSHRKVTLTRALFNAFGDGEPELGARLVYYLVDQSICYIDTGDEARSLQAIEEAYSIFQNQQNKFGDEDRFQVLHSEVLLQYARLTDITTSIKMAMEAAQILGNLLNIRPLTQSTFHEEIERTARASSSFLDQLFSSKQVRPIQIYAQALQDVGEYLSTDAAYSKTAVDLAYLAVAVRRRLVSLYGHEYRVDLANALSSLVQNEIARSIPKEQLVNLAEECIQLLRDLAEKNPPHYARILAEVLFVKAAMLEELNRDTEAIVAWEEVVRLAGQIIHDSQLCAIALDNLTDKFADLEKYDDALQTGILAITSYQGGAEIQAERYALLALHHQILRHYKEAVQAALKSVTLYQELAMKDPNAWMTKLAASLSFLALSWAVLGDSSQALLAWEESVSLADNFLDTQTGVDSDAIPVYRVACPVGLRISFVLKDKEESIKICLVHIRQLNRILEIYPRHEVEGEIAEFIYRAEVYYAYNMYCSGRLQDSWQYIDSWLDQWSSKPEADSDLTLASWSAQMINLKAGVFDAQGCTKQGLSATQEVQDVVKMSVNTSQPCFYEMIKSVHHEAQLKGRLGDSTEALATAERALKLARDSTLEPIIDSLIWSLHAVASTALLHLDFNRSVEAAQEGCKALNSLKGLKFDENKEFHSLIRPSMYALLSSAEANLGRYNTALEYAHRAVDLSLEIGENKMWISAATAQHSWIETRGNMAEILLATGDLAQARQICEERQAYFTERVEKRRGEYRELAPILRMFGILYCAEGRHEEGVAAATELAHIIKALGCAFPSLQEEVKIRLRHQVQVPILKVLNDMNEKLVCGHQAEISSLFAL